MHVLGTAGHVDHGKSTLIRALTGIEPDRLAEEKARGLTIDLGFAWMTLPSGREVGFVDVPGHERFVHNMLAGVGQIDATIFVVAADEGWKPQSEEHLAILDLLGARGGLIALTKADAAHDVERVEGDVRDRVRGTALDGAEVVRVSAVTGAGMDELRAAIDRMLDRTPEAPDLARPRLFVDRSFSIKGAGTVVTGTLTGGALASTDEVVILPAGTAARIRSIQTHQISRNFARPGSRVALNLAGLERSEIRRGDAVVRAGQWRPSTTLDVRLRAVRSLGHPVTAKGAYLLYLGTAEVPARLRLLDDEELRAGAEAFARLTLTEPVVAGMFDRLVLRDTGRRSTVAGGVVLDPHPAEARLGAEAHQRRVAELRLRADARPETIAGVVIHERGALLREEVPILAGARAAGHGVALETYVVSEEWLERTTATIAGVLARLHAERPLERGVPREEVRTLAGSLDFKLFAEVLGAIEERVVAEGPLLRLASHSVELSPELEEKRRALLKALEGFSPPSPAELEATYGATLIKAMIESGELTKLAYNIIYSAESMTEAQRIVTETIAKEGPSTASRLKEVLGTSRKYAIPLLDHLEASGVTVRRGDRHDLRGAGRPSR